MTSASLKPLVSVGLPVYNAESTLRRAIDSVLSQDYGHFELIISDNASTDGTEAICRTLAEQDRRIVYSREDRNRGPVWNFNHVVGLGKGTYFMRMSHDDVRAPTYLTKCVALLEANPDAVLSHSYTGAFYNDLSNVLCILTHDTLVGVRNPRARFMRVLKELPATAIDGVMRLDTLRRRTRLLQPYSSSDIVMTHELSLYGEFVQVPEVLFWRSGRAILTVPQEVHRSLGEPMPRLRLSSLVVLLNHLRSVRRSPLPLLEKGALALQIIGHVCAVAMNKTAFRSITALMGDRCPAWILRSLIARANANPNVRLLKYPPDLPPSLHPTWRLLDHRNLEKALVLLQKLDAKLYRSGGVSEPT